MGDLLPKPKRENGKQKDITKALIKSMKTKDVNAKAAIRLNNKKQHKQFFRSFPGEGVAQTLRISSLFLLGVLNVFCGFPVGRQIQVMQKTYILRGI